MKHIKKIVILSIVILIFIFPEEFFSAFAGIMIILFVLLLVIEILLDIYIVVMFLFYNRKNKG